MKVFISIALLISAHSVLASSQFGMKEIENLMIHDSGTIRVFLKGTPVHEEACDFKTPLILDENNKFFEEMYTALLAAVKTKSKVNGYVSGCITSWGKSFPRIVRLDIKE